MSQAPNILFIMTDQQRSDTIGALSNRAIRTRRLIRWLKLARFHQLLHAVAGLCPLLLAARQ